MLRNRLPSILLALSMLGATATILTANSWAQSKEQVLYTFTYHADGGMPFAGVSLDNQGNLYGTTYYSGEYQGAICCGGVFQLRSNGASWEFNPIRTFAIFDGEAPSGSVIVDASGNAYATSQQGGYDFCGIVYQLTPVTQGQWAETILHSFDPNTALRNPVNGDGCVPTSSLIFDQAGNLYGTTQAGGGMLEQQNESCLYGCGSVFRLSPQSNGNWREATLHRFPQNSSDGILPYAGVTFDSAGNLWGTTLYGGSAGMGTVFELKPVASGLWNETVVFNFTGTNGMSPYGGVVVDSAGNVYGTTFFGGTGAGVVYELSPQSNGQYSQTLLHQFAPCNGTKCPDGLSPYGGLALDSAGNLYGTTILGGAGGTFCDAPGSDIQVGCGTIFKLTRGSTGTWDYSIVFRFPGGYGGAYPTDDHLTIDANGNIFGTTFSGGDVSKNSICPLLGLNLIYGCGVVFEVAQ